MWVSTCSMSLFLFNWFQLRKTKELDNETNESNVILHEPNTAATQKAVVRLPYCALRVYCRMEERLLKIDFGLSIIEM